jgi:hypothetical protein
LKSQANSSILIRLVGKKVWAVSAHLTTGPTKPNGREHVVNAPGVLASQASEPGSPTDDSQSTMAVAHK